ncbi:hypothetical protein QOZ99_000796 [Angulomicrobium amanitiforme]|uniref:Uncharacterized protein n=1 Tax=Ancylobacter amanitiformis TaxID=217069 RepID=A0ABU0LMI8_9HYPH|nr:hypothetical protein [Ancylobacter amanitiformis]
MATIGATGIESIFERSGFRFALRKCVKPRIWSFSGEPEVIGKVSAEPIKLGANAHSRAVVICPNSDRELGRHVAIFASTA